MKKTFMLWENEVPYFMPEYGDFKPSITEYFLDNGKDNPFVLVIPGGGYSGRADDHEGVKICEALNSGGYSAAILNYRVAPYAYPVELIDAQRAMRLIRYNAKKWHIIPDKMGAIGFSAGGHLVCMLGTLYNDAPVLENIVGCDTAKDEIDKVSARPDNVAPCYAVSSLKPEITHDGTAKNILRGNYSAKNVELLSNENNIPDDCPPYYIFHTCTDNAVPAENALELALALQKKKIPYSLHVFPHGPHGVGLGNDYPLTRDWMPLYIKWLDDLNK